MAEDHYYGLTNGMVLTKPFEIGKTYKRVDGTDVTCISLSYTRGYETAQFSDFAETHARLGEVYAKKGITLSAKDMGEPEKSGYRYNRASDRGRCTGGEWDGYCVIPEPNDADYALAALKHLNLSFKDILDDQARSRA